MKKIICVILCVVMCLSLCGCIKVVVGKDDDNVPSSPSAKTDDKNDDKETGDNPDALLKQELWGKVSGIWMTQDIDNWYFAEFRNDGDGFFLYQGIPSSEYGFGGPTSDLMKENGEYQFTVSVPAMEATEEYEARDAYTLEYCCEPLSDSSMMLTNHAGDGSYVEWEYSCDSWDSFDWDSFFNDNSGVSLETAWNELKGVWTAKDTNGKTWFDVFGFENDEAFFSTGIPFSGYGMSGEITGFEDRTYDSTWWVNLHFDAVPANEMDSGRAAFDVLIMVDYSQLAAKKIDVTNIAGDGNVLTFEYRCETLNQLTID